MGWWQDRWEGKSIAAGDEPIDLIHELLRAFADSYVEGAGRKPVTAELLYSLADALRTTGRDLFSDLEAREVLSVRLTSRKAPKTQKYAVGDYFIVPLPGREFAYGRIIGQDSAGAVIEIYRLKTKRPLALPQVRRQATDILLQTHVNRLRAFRDRRWPILGHAPLPKDHPLPAFRLGHPAIAWQISQGGKVRTATTAEVLRLEPCVCWNPETVEERITSDHPEVWPELEVWQCRDFGDAYLKMLHDPDRLQALYFPSTKVTDAGLRHLARCSRLKTLDLFGQPITDAGLRHLARLDALEELNLGRTKVTDVGLGQLAGLKRLRKLGLKGTGVTDQGAANIARALPAVVIAR